MELLEKSSKTFRKKGAKRKCIYQFSGLSGLYVSTHLFSIDGSQKAFLRACDYSFEFDTFLFECVRNEDSEVEKYFLSAKFPEYNTGEKFSGIFEPKQVADRTRRAAASRVRSLLGVSFRAGVAASIQTASKDFSCFASLFGFKVCA